MEIYTYSMTLILVFCNALKELLQLIETRCVCDVFEVLGLKLKFVTAVDNIVSRVVFQTKFSMSGLSIQRFINTMENMVD